MSRSATMRMHRARSWGMRRGMSDPAGRALAVAAAVALVALVLVALPFAQDAGSAGSPTNVDMSNFAFAPPEITVTVGSVVRWTYKDVECDVIALCPGHNSVAKETVNGQPLWATDTFKGQGQYRDVTMTVTGRHLYVCTIHE